VVASVAISSAGRLARSPADGARAAGGDTNRTLSAESPETAALDRSNGCRAFCRLIGAEVAAILS